MGECVHDGIVKRVTRFKSPFCGAGQDAGPLHDPAVPGVAAPHARGPQSARGAQALQ